MNEKSIWSDTISLPSFPKLENDLDTNVLIIGGGIAGILCAYELKKRKIDCVLIEKDRIGNGKTKNTTAFITAQHETLYQDIIRMYGKKKAKSYLELNLNAIKKYQELGKKYDIDYEECSSTLFFNSQEEMELEKEALTSLGYNFKEKEDSPLNLKRAKEFLFLVKELYIH